MSFIGNTPTQQSFTAAVDVFSGNGSTTAFTLSRPVATVAQVEAFIENVPQSPVDAFTVNGSTITFTSAPPSGSSNIYVRYTSPITQVIQPSDGSVGLNTLSSAVMSAIGGMGFKNRIINGAMMIDQRNAGASVTPANDAYTLDRWQAKQSTASKFSVQQNAGAVTPPAGFTKYLGCTSLSAFSVGASDVFGVRQCIEGVNVADLGWGTANAQTVTVGFLVRSSLTGTFAGSLFNYTGARSYPFSYTISAANTWEYKTITVAGDTTGTWETGSAGGLFLFFNLGTGSSLSGTANAWAGTYTPSVTGAVSVVGTSGATFYITGVQLEKGSTATSFDYRPYGTELALCQRYYEKTTGNIWSSYGATYNYVYWFYKVTKRTTPTITGLATGTQDETRADFSGAYITGSAYARYADPTASAEL